MPSTNPISSIPTNVLPSTFDELRETKPENTPPQSVEPNEMLKPDIERPDVVEILKKINYVEVRKPQISHVIVAGDTASGVIANELGVDLAKANELVVAAAAQAEIPIFDINGWAAHTGKSRASIEQNLPKDFRGDPGKLIFIDMPIGGELRVASYDPSKADRLIGFKILPPPAQRLGAFSAIAPATQIFSKITIDQVRAILKKLPPEASPYNEAGSVPLRPPVTE